MPAVANTISSSTTVVSLGDGDWQVTGNGTILTITNNDAWGANQDTQVTVTDNAVVDAKNITLSNSSIANSKLKLTNGGRLMTPLLEIFTPASNAKAQINIGANSILEANQFEVNIGAGGGTAEINIDGSGAILQGDNNLFHHFSLTAIDSGHAQVNIKNGGEIKDYKFMSLANMLPNSYADLTIDGKQSKVSTGRLDIAGAEGSTAKVTLQNGAALSAADRISVGENGNGKLLAGNNASIESAKAFIIGLGPGSSGAVILDNSQLHSPNLSIGNQGNGILTLQNGANAIVDDRTTIGLTDTATGKLDIIGAGTTLQTKNMFIGHQNNGSGTLNISNGAAVTVANRMFAGLLNDSVGQINITGKDSTLKATNLYLGTLHNTQGTLHVAGGSKATANTIIIGNAAASRGAINITGKDSVLFADAGDGIWFGEGSGTLSAADGANLITPTIARDAASTSANNVSVSLDNSTLTLTDFSSAAAAAARQDIFTGFNVYDAITIGANGAVFDVQTDKKIAEYTPSNEIKITGAGQLTKTGTGKLTMSSQTKKWSKGTKIAQGILAVNGDDMNLDDGLTIAVNSDSDYGQLAVNGRLDIAGKTLTIDASKASKANLTSTTILNVVTANDLQGKFDYQGDNSRLFDFQPDYSDVNKMHLRVIPAAFNAANCNTAEGCVIARKNWVARPAAIAIDGIIDSAVKSGADSGIVDVFLPLSTAEEVSNAVAETLPHLNINQQLHQEIADAAAAAREHGKNTRSNALWGIINGSHIHLAADDTIPGYAGSRGAVVIGGDAALEKGSVIGAYAGYSHSNVDSRGNVMQQNVKSNTAHIGIYGDWHINDNLAADMQLGYAHSSIDGKRNIRFANRTADAKMQADSLLLSAGMQYQFGDEQARISPYIRTDYAYIHRGDYQESGASSLNLKVDADNFSSLVLGGGVAGELALNEALVAIGNIGMGVEVLDTHSTTTAAFADYPARKFDTPSRKVGRVIANIGLGIEYQPIPNIAIDAKYRGNFRNGLQDNTGQISIRWSF